MYLLFLVLDVDFIFFSIFDNDYGLDSVCLIVGIGWVFDVFDDSNFWI